MKRSRVILVNDDEETQRKHPTTEANEQINEEVDVEGVVFRCVEYLLLHSENDLPTSYDEIHLLLAKFCHQTLDVDSQVIFGQLLLNNIIALTSSHSVIVVDRTNNPNAGFQVFVPTDALFGGTHLPDTIARKISTDFIRTLSKIISWINSAPFQNNDIPLPFFMSKLREFCVIQVDVEPSVILNHFQLRGLISVSPFGRISYLLPNKGFVQPHYLPFCREENELPNQDLRNQDVEIF